MSKGAETRQRMIEATERLLRRDGYAATGWRTVVEQAGAPWGSAYHHFPDGKEQLAAEAVALGAAHVGGALDKVLATSATPAEGVRSWFALAAGNLEQSEFIDGCPVATVALETVPRFDRLSEACVAAIEAWKNRLVEEFTRAGAAPVRADQLATLTVSNLEGALLLARVARSTEPLDLAGELMFGLLQTELDAV
jgi:TetR/AcrR family transcriptional repressor of lmrAB and yxaGH operons